MSGARKAWTWRHAICKSDLPPTTRHVLHALSCWMNEFGGSCYPSTLDLVEATGYSERAVCTHLEKAESLGWLERRRHGFKGRGYRRHEYEARFPGSGRGPESEPNEVDSKGKNSDEALNEVQQVGSGALNEVQQVEARRTEPDDSDALNEVQHLRRPVHKPVQCSGASPPDNTQPDDEGLSKILLDAVGAAAANGGKGLGKLAVIRKWLDQGADLERDIVPAIRERAATMQPGALRSWRFMDGPIDDWMRDRKGGKAPPKPSVPAKPRDFAAMTDRQWRFWLKHLLNKCVWTHGPMPGDAGCMVPAQLIDEIKQQYGDDVFERMKRRKA